MDRISIVIPCYFNEQNIPVTTRRLLDVEDSMQGVEFEYVMVDDGSEDGTLDALLAFKQGNPHRITVIELAKNYGSYNAIYAGIQHAKGDCLVVMSADLQDSPELIQELYNSWKAGAKLVVASRIRRNEPFLQRILADAFHFLMKKIALPTIPKGGFDYCLFDKQLGTFMLDQMAPDINSLYLLLTKEPAPSYVSYQRARREIGTSKWTLKKKLNLALSTLLHFSLLIKVAITILLTLMVVSSAGLINLTVLAVEHRNPMQAICLGVLFACSVSVMVYLGERLYRFIIKEARKTECYKIKNVF